MLYSFFAMPNPMMINLPVKESSSRAISCPPLVPLTSKIFQPETGDSQTVLFAQLTGIHCQVP